MVSKFVEFIDTYHLRRDKVLLNVAHIISVKPISDRRQCQITTVNKGYYHVEGSYSEVLRRIT